LPRGPELREPRGTVSDDTREGETEKGATEGGATKHGAPEHAAGLEGVEPARWLDAVRWDERGLVTVVVQDALTGEVRMVAWADREALARTVATGEAHFFSRSRGRLWRKGETSGNVLLVRALLLDCDGDSALVLVEPHGPTCHTGAPSCFFRALDGGAWTEQSRPLPMMDRLEAALRARAEGASDRSYTRALLDAGPEKIGAKLREEADELARAVASESEARVAGEAADLVYHACVGLLARGVPWRVVLEELSRRFGTSGLDEKAARGPQRDR
jgi:phosphoribosyl-ATP pyrophosphohydrolase/phosphoribosyl-AMP cyclohydrolase